jgi:hypothetical protein
MEPIVARLGQGHGGHAAAGVAGFELDADAIPADPSSPRHLLHGDFFVL